MRSAVEEGGDGVGLDGGGVLGEGVGPTDGFTNGAAGEAADGSSDGTERGGGPSRVRIWPRDRQLLMALAEARLLSTAQLGELFFPGRHRSALATRLVSLERAGLVVRTVAHRVDGRPLTCWSLGRGGSQLVDGWLGSMPEPTRWTTPGPTTEKPAGMPEPSATPATGPGAAPVATAATAVTSAVAASSAAGATGLHPDFLVHHVFLTELYVRLVGAPVVEAARRVAADAAAGNRLERQARLGGLFARVEGRSWRWASSGAGLRLPWREYVGGAARERIIAPDALLELPSRKLRVFVEAETGSQPIASADPGRHGATLAKLQRYLAFLTGMAESATRRTWYHQRFGDEWRAELLLLVPAGRRREHVQAAVSAWRSKRPVAAQLSVVVLPLAEAVAHYGAIIGAEQALASASVSTTPLLAASQAEVPVDASRRPSFEAGRAAAEPRPSLDSHPSLDAERRVIRDFFETVRADLKRRQAEAARALGAGARGSEGRASLPVVPARYEEMKALVSRWSAEGP